MPKYFVLMLVLLFSLTACNAIGDDGDSGANDQPPENAIVITIVYAPESNDYMEQFIPAFNQSYRDGINPVTGEGLQSGEQPIFVQGEPGSSGTTMQGIVRAISNPSSPNAVSPTIFQPSVSHWLALANFQSGRDLFDLSDSPATANAPVVIAIWESRLTAIQNTVGYDEIGWEELLDVLNSPNGWADYGIPDGRRTVYYGHTDPFVSSTALSTLIAEFYASARVTGFTGRRLTMDVVQQDDVLDGVRGIENLIRHYSRRTTEFKNYIAQGPDYLDFVALEENDLIAINRGLTTFQPPERLVALYPKEGTFWHEHPMGIVNAPWVSDEQAQAARVFTDYILMPAQQEIIMSFGFRPVNPDIELGFPFEAQYGVTSQGPLTVLDVPDAAVINEIQASWSFVKKQADILLVIDTSGSMEEDSKLEQAKEAALAFLDNTEITNRVGLAIFDDTFRVIVEPDILETNRSELTRQITRLEPGGRTVLYNAIVDSVELMQGLSGEDNRIRAVVLLSDGEDTCSEGKCNAIEDAVATIESSENDLNPVIVVPVGYGRISTDLERVLDAIADASNTIWIPGDPDNIQGLLELISSFF
jgi:Ca-activated chloride channel homolog